MAQKKTTVHVNFRIEKETMDRVEEYSKEERIDKYEWIRRLIRNETSAIWADKHPYEIEEGHFICGATDPQEFQDWLDARNLGEIPKETWDKRIKALAKMTEAEKAYHRSGGILPKPKSMLSKKQKGGTREK